MTSFAASMIISISKPRGKFTSSASSLRNFLKILRPYSVSILVYIECASAVNTLAFDGNGPKSSKNFPSLFRKLSLSLMNVEIMVSAVAIYSLAICSELRVQYPRLRLLVGICIDCCGSWLLCRSENFCLCSASVLFSGRHILPLRYFLHVC